MAAGRKPGSAASISSNRNNAVGALPTATTEPCKCSRHSATAAAERVVRSRCRISRGAGIVQAAKDGVPGRQPAANDAAGDHLAVHQHAGAGAKGAAGGLGRRSLPAKVADDVGHPAGMHQSPGEGGEVRGEPAHVGGRRHALRREPVDGLGVPEVLVAAHETPSVAGHAARAVRVVGVRGTDGACGGGRRHVDGHACGGGRGACGWSSEWW